MNKFVDYIRLETYVGSSSFLNLAGLHKQVQSCLSNAKNKQSDLYLILSFAWECCPENFWYDHMVIPVRRLLKEQGVLQYKFVFNNSMLLYSTDRSDKSDCIFLEFMALLTYDRIFNRTQAINSKWNPKPDCSLMLIGKAEKKNRLPLLRKLLAQGSHVDYSLHMNNSIMSASRYLFPELDDTAFYDWCNSVCKSLDQIDIQLQDGSSNYVGFPYDAGIYQSRCFSIIPETNYISRDHIIISEKTWRTIVNRHPFLMASVPGTLQYLRTLGFKTYEQYQALPDYDHCMDDDRRLDAVVTNSMEFVKSCKENTPGIDADIEYNYKMFHSLVAQEIKKIDNILESLYHRTDNETAWNLVSRM
jgi:hypothetical protein